MDIPSDGLLLADEPGLAESTSGALPFIIFSLSMLLSAALLFVVEPMTGKMLMPLLGGTPAIWNTCLVFFQAVLLAGYLYAHAVLRWLPRRGQIALHFLVVLSPLAIVGSLPPHIPRGWAPPVASNPAGWLLLLLLAVIGVPFFALSANTSMMQRWFADSGRADSHDPYFLYSASNAGSLMGLFAYPLLVEPMLALHDQTRLWSRVYILFVALTAVCALFAWQWRERDSAHGQPLTDTKGSLHDRVEDREVVRWNVRWHWIALAFIPSSLMLGATSAITANIPAIPFFWVLPLAAYLIGFVLVFAKKPAISHSWIIERSPFLILAGMFPAVSQTHYSLPILLLLYLAVLFGLGLVFHGELARRRPSVEHLTDFYLCLSVGGVLGGIFNSLVAPMLFHTVLEWPLVLIFAALMRPMPARAADDSVGVNRKDILLPVLLFLCMVAVILGLARAGIRPGHTETILVFGYSLLWCLSFGKRRLRFVLGLLAIFLASDLYAPFGQTLVAQRSFFGVYRVRNSPDHRFRLLFHGGIIHGAQSLDPSAACEPLSYYSRSGPAGEIFEAVQSRMPAGNWAVVGLGAGAMASYMRPGQSLTFYEIDPLVAKIARDSGYFTYLSRCAPTARIILGDARLRLREAPDHSYGLIALDAFSGDSIPVHLLTREALSLYLRKLAPGGVIAFHISNLYFNLAPTLGNLAKHEHLVAIVGRDAFVPQPQRDAGKAPSVWLVMARQPADIAPLLANRSASFRWESAPIKSGARLWTDDYSNLLGVIRPATGE